MKTISSLFLTLLILSFPITSRQQVPEDLLSLDANRYSIRLIFDLTENGPTYIGQCRCILPNDKEQIYEEQYEVSIVGQLNYLPLSYQKRILPVELRISHGTGKLIWTNGTEEVLSRGELGPFERDILQQCKQSRKYYDHLNRPIPHPVSSNSKYQKGTRNMYTGNPRPPVTPPRNQSSANPYYSTSPGTNTYLTMPRPSTSYGKQESDNRGISSPATNQIRIITPRTSDRSVPRASSSTTNSSLFNLSDNSQTRSSSGNITQQSNTRKTNQASTNRLGSKSTYSSSYSTSRVNTRKSNSASSSQSTYHGTRSNYTTREPANKTYNRSSTSRSTSGSSRKSNYSVPRSSNHQSRSNSLNRSNDGNTSNTSSDNILRKTNTQKSPVNNKSKNNSSSSPERSRKKHN